MAKLLPIIPASDGINIFLRLRYLLAGIARCICFYDKELQEVATSAPCRAFAARATEHYFYQSRLSAIYADMAMLFQCLITITPILQRQCNSMGFDWHGGTVLTWFRVNTAVNVGRYFFACEEHSRNLDPLLLRHNLNYLRIYDSRFIDTLEMLFRAYYGRNTVTGSLANTLFDPIMLCQLGDKNTLRVGNEIFRLEKQAFPGCIDLRESSAVVLAYRIQRKEWQEKIPLTGYEHEFGQNRRPKTKTVLRGMLEIRIDMVQINEFKSFVKIVLKSGLSLKYKISVLDRRVGSFVDSVRHARSGFEQVVALSRWLRYRLEPLCRQADEKAKKRPDPLYDVLHRLPDIMVNKFMIKSDYKRYYRRPNFFYDPHEHDELNLLRFLSPYREVK